jgi:hypothetical protein
MMNVSMQPAGSVNDRGELLFVTEFDDGQTVVPITATADSFYDLGMKLARLAQDAQQWVRSR